MKTKRILLIGFAIVLLILVYLFQRFDYYGFFSSLLNYESSNSHPYTVFIVNKTIRFLLNDNLMLLIIWQLFQEKKYIKLGLVVELFGLLVILPIYFVIKLNLEGDSEISSPLLSFIHRLVVNPTLMILLIPAIYYSRSTED